MPSRHSHSYGPGLSRSLSVSVLPPLSLCPSSLASSALRSTPTSSSAVAAALHRRGSTTGLLVEGSSIVLSLSRFPDSFRSPCGKDLLWFSALRPTAQVATATSSVSGFSVSLERPRVKSDLSLSEFTLVDDRRKETSHIICGHDFLSLHFSIVKRSAVCWHAHYFAISVALYAYSPVLCWSL